MAPQTLSFNFREERPSAPASVEFKDFGAKMNDLSRFLFKIEFVLG